MASPQRQISSQYVDNQGFLIGEHRLAQLSKGIDQVADNTAEILALLKREREKHSQPALKPVFAPKPAKNSTLPQILPQLPPTVHSSSIKHGRQVIQSNDQTLSQVDKNQNAKKYGVYTGGTVNSTEIRDKKRDSKGRFISSGDSLSESGDAERSTTSKIASAVKEGVSEVANVSTPQGVDPTLDALNEIGATIAPAGRAFKYMGRGALWLFGRPNKRNEKLPKDQEKHNRKNERQMERLIDATRGGSGGGLGGLLGGLVGGKKGLLRLLPMLLSGLGGIVGAVVSGLTAAAPIIAAALAAVLVAWLAKKAWEMGNEWADRNRPEEQGDVNPDNSSNKGMIGLFNRQAKGIMNGVRGSLNSINGWMGGDTDYWDDGTAPDSKNRIGLKTDAVNVSMGKDSTQRMMDTYDAAIQAGFSPNQAKAMTAEVGRENGYDPKHLFGKHTDAANGVTNQGMFSWQGNRRDKLVKQMQAKGLVDKQGNFVQTKEALVEQMKFAKAEMESGDYEKTRTQFLENPNIDSESAAKVLGKDYVRWAYGQDRLRSGKAFDWKKHDRKRAGFSNKIDEVLASKKTSSPTTAKNATSTTPLVLKSAVSKSATESPEINKKAGELSSAVNDMWSGKTKISRQNSFAPASMSGILPAVLPPALKPFKIPDMPKQQQKLTSDAPQQVHVTNANDNISQNVGDRALAHAITGGLGMRK